MFTQLHEKAGWRRQVCAGSRIPSGRGFFWVPLFEAMHVFLVGSGSGAMMRQSFLVLSGPSGGPDRQT